MREHETLPPTAIPAFRTDISEWQRALRSEIRVVKREKLRLRFVRLRLRFKMVALGLQIFLLNTPDYLTALLIVMFRHVQSPGRGE